jgi:hypothetical protein
MWDAPLLQKNLRPPMVRLPCLPAVLCCAVLGPSPPSGRAPYGGYCSQHSGWVCRAAPRLAMLRATPKLVGVGVAVRCKSAAHYAWCVLALMCVRDVTPQGACRRVE